MKPGGRPQEARLAWRAIVLGRGVLAELLAAIQTIMEDWMSGVPPS